MADQLSNTVSGATNAAPIPGLSAITGTLQGSLSNITATGQSLLDRFLPPATRENLKEKMTAFATSRPLLASFLLSQVALSGLPIALFVIMTITVVVFALLTGILVGVIGALVFVVIALLFALFVLLPTLFVTTFFAVAVWLWGVGAYYLVKWFNEKRVPGVHVPFVEGMQGVLGQTGSGGAKEKAETNGTDGAGHEKSGAETGQKRSGSATAVKKESHHADGKEHRDQTPVAKSSHHQKKVHDGDQPSTKTPTKGLADAGQGVTDVGKGVTGLVT